MISYSNSLLRGSGMPIQVNGALRRAPCPVPSCPACEPNSGSVHPSLSMKATQVERGRHCYAIKWLLVRTYPVSSLASKQSGGGASIRTCQRHKNSRFSEKVHRRSRLTRRSPSRIMGAWSTRTKWWRTWQLSQARGVVSPHATELPCPSRAASVPWAKLGIQ